MAITVTFGNVGLRSTVRNALSLCELADVDVPVYVGAGQALLGGSPDAAEYHGESGLGARLLPEPRRRPTPGRAAEKIVELALAYPGEVTLVATAALTNVALALSLEPRLADVLAGIVLMAGSVDEGNTTPSAEFNAYADPHALKVVLDCGAPITMFGLNVTHQVLATPARIQQLRAGGTPIADYAADLLTTFAEPYREIYGWDGAPVHDPCTVAHLIDPTLFDVQAMAVQVDTNIGLGLGRTVCDIRGLTDARANVNVATRADPDRFFSLLTERLNGHVKPETIR